MGAPRPAAPHPVKAGFLIRDRDAKNPALFDALLADAGIETVLTGVRMPRMNSIMEPWVQTWPRQLLCRLGEFLFGPDGLAAVAEADAPAPCEFCTDEQAAAAFVTGLRMAQMR